MKRAVDEHFNYSLRPAKNIERKMLMEVFRKLDRLAALSSYRYIGFGSRFFGDFALCHKLLDVGNMISIEMDVDRKERFLVNKPLRSIHMMWGRASRVLPLLSWRRRAVVWLDYECGLTDEVLQDIATVVGEARSGSFLTVTVNVHPAPGKQSAGSGVHDYSSRLEKIQRDLGDMAYKIPADVAASHMAHKWSVADVVYRIICAEIDAAIKARNGGCGPSRHVGYSQAIHFRYADGACMLTVGGLIANDKDATVVRFDGCPGFRPDSDARYILAPVLTDRERQELDRLLPERGTKSKVPGWISTEDWEHYRSVYRYFPAFVEAER